MAESTGVEVGTLVKFTGFTSDDGEQPDNGELLKKGKQYEVVSVSEGDSDDEETSYVVKVENPDYDSSKRAGKNNQEFLHVDLFEDEFSVAASKKTAKAPAKAAAPAKTPAKKTAKTKAVVEEEDCEDLVVLNGKP